MSKVSALKPADYIKKTVGSIMFTYYSFVKEFRLRPKDLTELIDGHLYMMSTNYIQKQELIDSEAEREKKSNKK